MRLRVVEWGGVGICDEERGRGRERGRMVSGSDRMDRMVSSHHSPCRRLQVPPSMRSSTTRAAALPPCPSAHSDSRSRRTGRADGMNGRLVGPAGEKERSERNDPTTHNTHTKTGVSYESTRVCRCAHYRAGIAWCRSEFEATFVCFVFVSLCPIGPLQRGSATRASPPSSRPHEYLKRPGRIRICESAGSDGLAQTHRQRERGGRCHCDWDWKAERDGDAARRQCDGLRCESHRHRCCRTPRVLCAICAIIQSGEAHSDSAHQSA